MDLINRYEFLKDKSILSVKFNVRWLYFCALCFIALIIVTSFPCIATAQDIKVYDEHYNLKYRVKGDKVYDEYWNLRYRIKDDKIYDKDWNIKYRIEEDKIYDRDWNLRYRKEENNIYDKDYRQRFRLKTED